MGGKHCCVVGCTNSSKKTGQGTNYFGFPKDAEWRSTLIAAVNRCDSGFNPDSMHICSAHFEPSCLLLHD
ncbi:THAP domain-containing protein 11 [Mizuhopecten yessoensis]|uniref:THAP domain-containing protein 11 n=1 Tax=Mizuhopecten yessoensis TaxID=6573 RepID=A0A210Q2R0_MIZYE|nr:THAP domain-containing protein 11 [Mizuhopecten yessoensis]